MNKNSFNINKSNSCASNNLKINQIKAGQKKSSKKEKKKKTKDIKILTSKISNTVWLSVSESAKIGSVNTKTIRRAIQSKKITYKIIKNRYLIDFSSFILYLYSKNKLKNKLNQFGIGQYIEKWKK